MARSLPTALLLPFLGLLFAAPASGQQFFYHAPNETLQYDVATGIGSGVIEFLIEEEPSSPGYPNQTVGFSMGVAHDGSLLAVTGLEPSGPVAATNDGDGPEFFGSNLAPVGGTGWTLGCVYEILGQVSVPFPSALPAVESSYVTNSAALAGDTVGVATMLSWTNGLGQPAVLNVVVVGSVGNEPTLLDGVITLAPFGIPFLRGDADGDGDFNGLADALAILAFQFLGGPAPPCLEAADADGDSTLNGLVDALLILVHQFNGGPPPAPPYPDCGDDPDPGSTLGCDASPC